MSLKDIVNVEIGDTDTRYYEFCQMIEIMQYYFDQETYQQIIPELCLTYAHNKYAGELDTETTRNYIKIVYNALIQQFILEGKINGNTLERNF